MVDHERGGFYGRIDGEGKLFRDAPKGVVLNARILWTFSAAYRLLGKEAYLSMARRAYDYLVKHFIDPRFGGVYWEVDCEGRVLNRKKQTYAQGFALYGFSEYHRATGCPEALERAIAFFRLIERCRDKEKGGYLEAYAEDWSPIEDVRLSEKDENEIKTMNTHLHILEPYTNLYRIWPDEELKEAQVRLIALFSDRIIDKQSAHLNLFFDEDWRIGRKAVSYGHDIEAAWLLYEASEVLGDTAWMARSKAGLFRIADAAREGLLSDGSMAYEWKEGELDAERHWWVQAEAVVGYMYAWKLSGDAEYRKLAEGLWRYIREQLVDKENGEWYWSRLRDGSVNRQDDKAGFWKCPYHNSRMCMEMIVMNKELEQ